MKIIKQQNSITVICESGFTQVFLNSFPYIKAVEQAVEENNEEVLMVLRDVYKNLVSEDSFVEISEEGLSVNGVTLEDDKLTLFIQKLQRVGIADSQIEYIKPFIKNMLQNPYIDATTELYDYCREHDFVITPDGCFLAYKNVNANFTSIHDGTTLNGIGMIVEEPYFDTDRTQTCSKGLHFCSKEYLSIFPGAKTIIVKVNPRDVVAIPIDYSFTKGRCRRYEVVAEINKDMLLKDYYAK